MEEQVKTHLDWCLEAFDQFIKEKKIIERMNHDSNGLTILDIGARDLCMKQPMEDRGFKWYGIDPYPRDEEVRFGTFEKIGYEDHMFDVVFACHAFEHCEHPVEALREMRRVCKPGGYLFLATPMPCEHHIVKADPDHIMVLMPIQFGRLLQYTGWREITSNIHPGEPLYATDDPVQNHTVITIGRK